MSTVHKYTPEDFEREFGDEGLPAIPTSSAASALAAHVGVLDYQPPVRPDYLKSDDIEAVGCRFGDAANVLMEYKEMPDKLRHLVLTIAFLSGGDYQNFTVLTQAQIAGRMGVDPRTIRTRMRELDEWQRGHAITFLQYEEHELERHGGEFKYPATSYRPVVVGYAAELLRIIEARRMRPINRQNVRADLVGEIAEDAIDEVVSQMPYADIKRREQKTKNVTPAQARLGFLDRLEQDARRALLKWRDSLAENGYEPDIEEMGAKILDWLGEPKPRRDNFRSY